MLGIYDVNYSYTYNVWNKDSLGVYSFKDTQVFSNGIINITASNYTHADYPGMPFVNIEFNIDSPHAQHTVDLFSYECKQTCGTANLFLFPKNGSHIYFDFNITNGHLFYISGNTHATSKSINIYTGFKRK